MLIDDPLDTPTAGLAPSLLLSKASSSIPVRMTMACGRCSLGGSNKRRTSLRSFTDLTKPISGLYAKHGSQSVLAVVACGQNEAK